MAQARKEGFSLLAVPVVIGVLLLGSVTVAVVSSDQETQQAGQARTPSIQGNVNPKDDPLGFCNQNPSFCSGNTVNTNLPFGR